MKYAMLQKNISVNPTNETANTNPINLGVANDSNLKSKNQSFWDT